MISTDFAPNERLTDALVSVKTLLQPWSWKKGQAIQKVKRRLKSYFPSSNIFLFLSGRAALNQLLKSLNLPKNSEVLVQGFTCEAVILPVIANDLKPVYVDIETKTLSMDIKELQKKISKKSKVLILQHTFGLTPQYREQILTMAKENDLFVIEDLAHGFTNPTSLKLRGAGNSAFLLSFGRSKAFSSLFGGAIVSNNTILNRSLQIIEKNIPYPSSLFIIKALFYKPLSVFIKMTYDIYLGKIIHTIARGLSLFIPEITVKEKRGEYDYLFNKAYPNALAKLMLHQLNKFERNKEIRIKSSLLYERILKEKGFNPTFFCDNQPLLRYPILVEGREAIIKKARKNKVFLGLWYDQVIAPKSIKLHRFQYRVGECKQAEKICEKIINLPTLISEKQVKKVINSL